MKIIEKVGAQGDVFFTRVAEVPAGAHQKDGSGAGRVIVAHSETGHHHVAAAENMRLYGTADPMVMFLDVKSPHADIVHERDFDTHETLRLPAGVWEVRRQREATSVAGFEGWRAVED